MRVQRFRVPAASRTSALPVRMDVCGSPKAVLPRSAASMSMRARSRVRAAGTKCDAHRDHVRCRRKHVVLCEESQQDRSHHAAWRGDAVCGADRECRTRRYLAWTGRQRMVFRDGMPARSAVLPPMEDHRVLLRHFTRQPSAFDCNTRRRDMVQRSRRQPHRLVSPRRRSDRISDPRSRQPTARNGGTSGRLIWFVETSANALGRIDRHGRITRSPELPRRTRRCAGSVWRLMEISGSPRTCRQQHWAHASRRSAGRRISYPGGERGRALHLRLAGRSAVLHRIRCRLHRRNHPIT